MAGRSVSAKIALFVPQKQVLFRAAGEANKGVGSLAGKKDTNREMDALIRSSSCHMQINQDPGVLPNRTNIHIIAREN